MVGEEMVSDEGGAQKAGFRVVIVRKRKIHFVGHVLSGRGWMSHMKLHCEAGPNALLHQTPNLDPLKCSWQGKGLRIVIIG